LFLKERLYQLRTDAGLTQEELAKRINVGRSTIAGYEKGTTQPSYTVLILLADYFEVSLDYLFGRTNMKTDLKKLEGKLKSKSGLVPIDMIFRLNEVDKDVVTMLLYSYMVKEEYRKKTRRVRAPGD
jgi:transcriptional regulator